MRIELQAETEAGGIKAQDLLHSEQLSAQQIIDCFVNGAVWLKSGGKPVRLYDAEARLSPGQKIYLYCNQSTLTACPYQAELVQDFQSFGIWYKPSGMLSQGSKWGDHWTLHRWIKKNIWPERECLITHRLDRFTQGLMIVAHQQTVNRYFHRLFEQRQVEKTYHAIVSGQMPVGEQMHLTTPINHKKALTEIRVMDNNSHRSLLKISPKTGRKHQIRIHLAGTGHPIINDRQYGQPPFTGDLMLQASGLKFKHPETHLTEDINLGQDKLLQL